VLRARLDPSETVVAHHRAVMVTDLRVLFAWEAWPSGWHSDAISFEEITGWALGRRHDERPILRIDHPTHVRLERVTAHHLLWFAWGNAEGEVPHDDVTLTFARRRDPAFRALFDRLAQSGVPRSDDFVISLPGTRSERTHGSRSLYRRTLASRVSLRGRRLRRERRFVSE
jgi:hypothetical protein